MIIDNEIVEKLLQRDAKTIDAIPVRDIINNRFIDEYRKVQSSSRISDDLMTAFDDILACMRIHEFDEPHQKIEKKTIHKLTFDEILQKEIKKFKI